LADEKQAPVFDESFRFDVAETFEEKKRLIHRKEAEVDKIQASSDDRAQEQLVAQLKRCADSDWDFDRIAYYIWSEAQAPKEFKLEDELRHARRELEKINAKSEGISLMPLNYSLGPMERTVSGSLGPAQAQAVKMLCKEIREFVRRTGMDAGGHVRGALSRIEESLARSSQPLTTAP
jgi:hypothetical protein